MTIIQEFDAIAARDGNDVALAWAHTLPLPELRVLADELRRRARLDLAITLYMVRHMRRVMNWKWN